MCLTTFSQHPFRGHAIVLRKILLRQAAELEHSIDLLVGFSLATPASLSEAVWMNNSAVTLRVTNTPPLKFSSEPGKFSAFFGDGAHTG